MKVYFFGSRARGDHKNGSDLDVGLEIAGDDSGFVEWMFSANELRSTSSKLTDLSIDLQLIHPDDSVVGPAVRDHGILVFERKVEDQ